MILKGRQEDIDTKITTIICNCHSQAHQISFYTFEKEDTDVLITFHLSKLPFRKRFINGLKYIFGKKSIYGDFEEVSTTKTELSEVLKEIINE